jgi:hypothetical protein
VRHPGEPFKDHGHSLLRSFVSEHISRENLAKVRLIEETLCCFGEISSQIHRGTQDFFKYCVAAIDDCDEVLEIATGKIVILASTSKCFHFGCEEEGRGDDFDRQS